MNGPRRRLHSILDGGRRTFHLAGVLAAALILPWVGVTCLRAQTFPGTMNFQGRLTDASNNPLSGAHTLAFALYAAPTGGTALWSETQSGVSVNNGVFAVQLGAVTPLSPLHFSGSGRWLQVTVDGTPLTPRERLAAAPFAFNAGALDGRSYLAFVSTDAAVQSIAGDKTFTGALTVPAPTLFAGAAADPAGSAGALYYNSASNKLRLHIGSGFVDIATGTAGTGGGTTYAADELSLHLAGGQFSALASSVTLQGNSFNAADRLVKLDASNRLPAVNASLLTNLPAASAPVAPQYVDLSTVTAALNLKLTSGAVPAAFVDLSTVTSALAGKLDVGAALAPGSVDFSTITAALNLKLTSGAVPAAFVDLSTVTSALAGKLDVGAALAPGSVDFSTITAALNLKLTSGAVPAAFVDLSTVTGALDARVLKSGDQMSGDLNIGAGALATQYSTSGYMSLANLGVAPVAARGRLYFSSAGEGSLRVSLDGNSFVSLATGSAGSWLSAVVSEGQQFGGDGTSGNALTLLSSSVTLQGNSFNAADRLVKLDASNRLPAVNASLLTNLPAASAPVAPQYVDLSTVTAALNLKLTSGAVPAAFVDLSTVTSALAGKLDVGAALAPGSVDFSTITAALNLKLTSGAVPTDFVNLSTVTDALALKLDANAAIPQGSVNLSTVTAALSLKLTSGAVPADFVNLSTVTDALALKLDANAAIPQGSVNLSTVTAALNLKLTSGAVPAAFIDLSTVTSALDGRVAKAGDGMTGPLTMLGGSTITVQGNAFSVGGSTLVVRDGRLGVSTGMPQAKLDVVGNELRLGPLAYPASYSTTNSGYLVMDKSGTAGDASIVFRDQGNARAEIGLVTDNDVHFKTVTGSYGSEVFTDRLLIRAAGQVDAFGPLRSYAVGGIPFVIAGNSDGSSTGAGLELSYDFGSSLSRVTSIERGNAYRDLVIEGGNLRFLSGTGVVSEYMRITPAGNVGVGSSAPGYRLTVSSGAGEAGDILVVSTGASKVFRVTGQGEVYANKLFGDGSALTGITGGVGKVDKAGDSMTGSLTMLGNSTITVQGDAFSVGGSTLVVAGGRVGIGTTSPGARLHIHDATTANKIRLTGAGVGSPTAIQTEGELRLHTLSDGAQTLKVGALTVWDSYAGNPPNGGVIVQRDSGIGTDAPAARLHVSSASALATDTVLQVSSGTGQGQELFVVKGNGRVGVGTGNPSSRLSVQGWGASYALAVSTDPEGAAGNLLVNNAGNTSLKGTLKINSDGLNPSTRFLVMSSYGQDGVIRINPGTDSTIYMNRETGAARDFHVWNGVVSDLLTVIGASGNVGIGTNTPGTRLHVSSGAGETGDLLVVSTGSSNVFRVTGQGEVYANKLYGDGSALTGVAGGADKLAKAGDGMTGPLTMLGNSTITVKGDAFSVGGSTFVVAGGRVGVGTQTPAQKMHIFADATIGEAEPYFQIEKTHPSVYATRYLTKYGATGLESILPGGTSMGYELKVSGGDQAAGGGGINLKTDGDNSRIFVRKDGNVGIGTTGPGYKLDVAGTMNAQEVRVNGVVLNPGTGSNWTVSGADVYRGAGNVGIGTTSPAYTLHLKSGSNPVLNLENPTAGAWVRYQPGNAGSIVWQAGANHLGWSVYDGQNSLYDLTVSNSGNVGAGTSVPTARLHVSSGAGETGDILIVSTGASNVFRVTGQGEVYANKLYGDGSALTGVTGGSDRVLRAGDGMTGPLTMLGNSTVTVKGDAFSVGGATLSVRVGRVGIGTASPSQVLDVNGNINIGAGGSLTQQNSAVLRLADNINTVVNPIVASGRVYLNWDTGSGTIFGNGDGSGFGEIARLSNDGKFGLGTMVPVARLHVSSANAAASDTLFYVSSGTLASQGLVAVKGNGYLGIGIPNPSDRLHVKVPGLSNEGMTLQGTDNNLLSILPSRGAGASNALVQAGDSSIIFSRSLVNTGALVIGPWASFESGLRLKPTGQIGVGVSDAQARLHISSGAGESGNILVVSTGSSNVFRVTGQGEVYANKLYGDGSALTGVTGGSDRVLRAGDGMTGPLTMLGNSTITVKGDAFSVGGSTFVVAGGRVGVGTTDPASAFHVTSGGSNRTIVTVDTYGGDGGYFIGRSAGGTASAPAATGAADALAAFQGVGYDSNGFGVRQADIVMRSNEAWTPTAHGTYMIFRVTPNGSTTIQEAMRLTGGGNVGIGTTVPGVRLSVQGTNGAPAASGTAQTYAGMRVQNQANDAVLDMGINGGSSWLQATDKSNLASNYTLALNPNGGNVGIGTTGPGYKLDVAGTMNAQEVRVNGVVLSPGTGSNWTVTGSDIYRAAGKVGIGTTAPQRVLDISGSNTDGNLGVRITPTGASGYGPYVTLNASLLTGGHSWALTSGGSLEAGGLIGKFALMDNSAGGVARLVVDPAAQMGIGTTAPGARLHVSSANAVAADTVLLVSSGTGQGQEMLAVKGDGKVGIGTAAPGTKLDVNGGGVFRGWSNPASGDGLELGVLGTYGFIQHYNRTSNSWGDLLLGYGNVGIGLTAPSARLHVSSGAGETGDILIVSTGSSNVFRVTGQGEVYANKLYGDGSALTGVTGGSDRVLRAGDGMTGPLTMLGNSTITVQGDAFSVGGSTLVVTGGRVGIGTAAPAFRMQIYEPNGTGDNGVLNVDGTGNPIISLGGSRWLWSSVGSYLSLGVNGYGHGQLVIKAGDVGAGTSAPTARLHVSSANAVAADTVLLVSSGTGQGQELLVVKGGGKVGIGTANPSARLSVSGGGISTDDYLSVSGAYPRLQLTGDDSTYKAINLIDSTSNEAWQVSHRVGAAEQNKFQIGYFDGTTWQTPHLTMATNGNVGIGTTAPGYKLDVAGTMNAQEVRVNGVVLSPGTGSNWTVTGSDIYRAAGKVGIGTTSPAAALNIGPVSTSHTGGAGLEIASPFLAANHGQLALYTTDAAAADKGGELEFGGIYSGGVNTTWATIGGYKDNSVDGNYGGYMAFATREHGLLNAERMRITGGGRVGMGTTVPAARLHVSSANAGATDTVLLVSSGTGQGQELLIVKGDGKVGVGTPSPSQMLDVGGSINIGAGGNLTQQSNAVLRLSDNSNTVVNPIVSSGKVFLNWDTGAGTIFGNGGGAGGEIARLLGDGKFGLGTTVPAARLHVSSAGALATDILLYVTSGPLTSNALFSVRGGGDVGVGLLNPTNRLHVRATSLSAEGLLVDADDGNKIWLLPSRTMGGSNPLVQSGDASLIFSKGALNTGALLIGPWANINAGIRIKQSGEVGVGVSDASARLHVSSANAVAADAVLLVSSGTSQGQELFVVKGDGKVGMGKSNPMAKLDLGNGDVGLGAYNTIGIGDVLHVGLYGNSGSWADNQGNASIYFKKTDAASSNAIGFVTYDAGVSNTTRMYIAPSGNVGIGTSAPGYKLDVAGTMNAQEVRVNGVVLSPGTGSNWTVTGSDIYRAAGRVGIGSTSPGAPLTVGSGPTNYRGTQVEVYGTTSDEFGGQVSIQSSDAVAADKGGRIVLGGKYMGVNDTPFAYILGAKENAVDGQYGGYLALASRPHMGSPTERIRITGAGRVGVGTTSPTAQLHVSSPSAVAGEALLKVSSGTSQGQELLVVKGDGKVGIGVASPGYRLDVAGNLIARQSVNSDDGGIVVLSADGTSRALRMWAGNDATARIESGLGGTGILTLNSGGGKVGIGTGAPAAVLDIQSTLADSQGKILRFTSAGSEWLRLTRQDASSTALFQSSGSIVLQPMVGNVGIGVISPLSTLSVSRPIPPGVGVSSASLYLRGSDNGYGLAMGNLTGGYTWLQGMINDVPSLPLLLNPAGGNVGVGVANPTAKLHVGGTAGVDGIRFPDGTLMTTAGVGSASNLANTVDAVVNADSDANASGAVRLQTGGSDRLYIANGGNVGVGTTNPTNSFSHGLHLQSSVGTALTLERTNATAAKYSLGVNTLAQFGIYDETNAAYRMVVSNAGSVGIGTTAPGARLHVSSASALAADTVLLVSSGTGQGQELLVVKGDGKVGIGTSSPSAALHISSFTTETGLARGNFLHIWNNAGLVNTKAGINLSAGPAIGGGLSFIYSKFLNAGTGASSLNFATYNGSSWVDPNMTIDYTGNVGIGISGPYSALHVSSAGAQVSSFLGRSAGAATLWGGSYTEGGFTNLDFSNSGTGAPVGRIGVQNTAAGSYMFLGTSNNYGTGITNTAFVINQSGNIGVGTASPDAIHQLHIKGPNANIALQNDNDPQAASSAMWTLESEAWAEGNFGIARSEGGVWMSSKTFVLTPAGNAAIGTTATTAKLHVNKGSALSTDTVLLVSSGTGSGQGLLVVKGDGKVGLGTASPGRNLHLKGFMDGGLQIQTADSVAGVSRIELGSRLSQSCGDIIWDEGSQGLYVYATCSGGGSGKIVLSPGNSGGNVGIGVTNPTAKLHIGGTAGVDGIRFPDGTLMTTAGVGSASNLANTVDAVVNADSDANASGAVRLQTGGSDRLYIANGGNVGIGTNSPGNILNLAQDVTFANSASGQFMIQGVADSSKRLAIGLDTTNNYAWINTQLSGGYGYPLVLNPNWGNVGIGTTSPVATLDVKTGPGNAYAVGISSNNGTRLMVIQHNGNVGIGTTSPGAALDISNGSLRATGIGTAPTSGTGTELYYRSDLGSGFVLAYDRSAGQYKDLGVGSALTIKGNGTAGVGVGVPAAKLHVSSANAVAADTLMLVSSGTGTGQDLLAVKGDGKVGLGTAGPSSKLHIQGSGSTAGMTIESTSHDTTGIILKNTFGSWGIRNYNTVADALQFTYGAGADALTITTAAKVGVGTTDPKLTLVTYSLAAAPTNSGTTPTGNNVFESNGSSLYFGSYAVSPWGYWMQAADRTDLSSLMPIVLNPLGGNVGIGTTAPDSILHLKKPSGTTKLKIDNAGSGGQSEIYMNSNASPWVLFTQDTYRSGNLIFDTNEDFNSTTMEITRSGNVGIATTSPQDKLHVKGDVRIETGSANYCILRVSDNTSCSSGTLIGTNANRALCLICN